MRGKKNVLPVFFFLVVVTVFLFLRTLRSCSQEEITDSYRVIQAGIASGDINPVIGQRFTLEQAAQAHDDILNNKGTLGKSVFTIE